MKVNSRVKPLVFTEEGSTVVVQYDNRGEPFREGVDIGFESSYGDHPVVGVLLEVREVVQLRDKLNEFLGHAQKATGRQDLVGLLPVVHNGKSAEEWSQLHAQTARRYADVVIPWLDMESAPKDGKNVVLWYEELADRVFTGWFTFEKWQTNHISTRGLTPTKWRPMLPLPTVTEET